MQPRHPDPAPTLDRHHLGLAAAAVVGLGLVWTAPPGLTWLDAGELGAAAAELSVAHPPGFPVFVLLHHGVMRLLPLGDVAFRGNLASALMAAAAVWALAFAARGFGARPWAAAVGALLAAVAPLAVLHGQTIEVYSGLGLWLGLALGCAARALAPRPGTAAPASGANAADPGRDEGKEEGGGEARAGDARWAGLAGLLAGLALGHHPELRLVVPALVLAGAPLWWRRPRVLGVAALAGLVGAAVVALLPLRSAAEPWRDWGHPATLSALWDHLSGLRIRAAYADRFLSFSAADLQRFVAQTLGAAPALAAAGLAGLLLLARRPAGWLVAATWALDLAYSVALNPMGLGDRQNGVLGLAALGVGAAVALDRLAARGATLGARRAAAGVAALAVAAGLLVNLDLGAEPPDSLGARQADRGLPRVLAAALDEAPPEGVALVVSDHLAAGLAFAQVAEGARPDVAVLVRQHLWDASSVGPVRRRLPALLPDWRPRAPAVAVGAVVAALSVGVEPAGGAPARLRWEWGRDHDAEVRPAGLVPRFPWFGRGRESAGNSAGPGPGMGLKAWLTSLGALVEALGPGGLADAAARRGLAGLSADLGFWALAAGDGPGSVAAFGASAALDPAGEGHHSNLSQARLRLGDVPGAVAAAEAALAVAPESAGAALNLLRLLVAHRPTDGRIGDLIAQVLAGGEARQQADALALRGVMAGNAGDLVGAGRDFQAALALEPTQAEAQAGLQQVQRLLSRP